MEIDLWRVTCKANTLSLYCHYCPRVLYFLIQFVEELGLGCAKKCHFHSLLMAEKMFKESGFF